MTPEPLRDHRSQRTRLITAAVLTIACLTLTGFVQSLRDTAINRLPSGPVTTSTGVGASLSAAKPAAPKSHFPAFFGISGSLVLIGLIFSYVTTDPVVGRARAARTLADVTRKRRDALRAEAVSSARAIRGLEAQIAVTVVNATRDVWVAEGWGEVDILERMRANPAIAGTWTDTPAAARPVPPLVGEAHGLNAPVAPDAPPARPARVETAELEAIVMGVAQTNGHGT